MIIDITKNTGEDKKDYPHKISFYHANKKIHTATFSSYTLLWQLRDYADKILVEHLESEQHKEEEPYKRPHLRAGWN